MPASLFLHQFFPSPQPLLTTHMSWARRTAAASQLRSIKKGVVSFRKSPRSGNTISAIKMIRISQFLTSITQNFALKCVNIPNRLGKEVYRSGTGPKSKYFDPPSIFPLCSSRSSPYAGKREGPSLPPPFSGCGLFTLHEIAGLQAAARFAE